MNRIPLPPTVYVAAIALAIVLNWLYPLPWFGRPLADILTAIGGLALLAFVLLFAGAVRAMRKAGTTLEASGTPEHLVTSGPFAVSRNPIYLAATLLLVGIGLMTGIAWFLLTAIGAASIVQKIAIESEERLLATRFGKRYRDYAKRIRRWI